MVCNDANKSGSQLVVPPASASHIYHHTQATNAFVGRKIQDLSIWADSLSAHAITVLLVLSFLARDCDSGVNSELSYFVHSADFDITSGGVVSSARRLDYERPNHIYEFVVVAVDAGTPPRTGTASVRIRVANSNDEAPVFSQSVYKTFLSEDAGPDTLVAIVHANDPDGDAVSYAITGGNEDSNFLLDNQK
ncbi:neural-cadherin, partial [Lates japonicus]